MYLVVKTWAWALHAPSGLDIFYMHVSHALPRCPCLDRYSIHCYVLYIIKLLYNSTVLYIVTAAIHLRIAIINIAVIDWN